MRSRIQATLILSLTLAAAHGGLMAQDQAGDQQASAPGGQASYGEPVLEEIIVTAQKRDELLQDVPIAISVLTARDLQLQQIYDPTQLQYAIPSLQQQSVNNQVGATNFFIRGVGTAIYGPAVESAVSTVIDDVALARPAMGVVQFFDLERVEVLRGPQGMLFGKNASAGLVHIVTARPRLGEVEALAHLSYGVANSGTSGNETLAQVAYNAPVSEQSAARVSAFYTNQDGFMDNIYMDEDLGLSEYGLRVKYLWQPSEDLEVFASADYAHESGPAGSVLARRYDAPGGFIEAQDAAAGIVASPDNVDIASNAPTDNHFALGGAQVNILYTLGSGHTLTNIAAYRMYRDRSALDTDTLPIRFFDGNDQTRKQHQFSNELRFTSPIESAVDYQVGLYYLKVRDEGSLTQTADLDPFFPPPPPGFVGNFGGTGSSTIYNDNYAGFGQARYAFTDTLRLIAGGRLTHDEVEGVATASGEGYVIPSQPTGTLTAGLSETNFSYRFGAEWDLTPDMMGYLTYARGYKSPTFGGATGTDPIKPEIPKNIEAGLKSSLFDRRLSLNLAIYHVTFKDYQAQAYDPQALRFTTTNAGEVRSQGVELDFRAAPIDSLILSGGFAYNDAVYESFSGLPCYFGQPTGTDGTNVCLPNGTTDVSGNQLAYAPEWTAALSGEYSRPLNSSYEGFITANYYYRSSVYFTAAHDPKTYLGDFSMVGGSIGVQTSDGRLRAALFVRNLFDERVPTFIVADVLSTFYGDDLLGGNYWHQFGESSFRTIGISLDWRY